MQSSENTNESSDENILNFLDSMDAYLGLIDSLSSSLRQGWLELASARYSMGASRVNSALFDLKSHHASTTLQVEENDDTDIESPRLRLSKWASSEGFEMGAKFEEDELLQNKFDNLRLKHHELQDKRAESGGSHVTPTDQAGKERFKSLSMFGTLVSPKLRATQLSFETALETLVEISNVRASLLCAYDQVQKDLNTTK